MKHILLIALLLVPSLAMAQMAPTSPATPSAGFTPVPKDKANTYFESCAAQPPQGFSSADSQRIFCACTAARMTQFYSMEDMQAAFSPDPAVARPAYNRMITEVYAPCMDTPAYEYYHKQCITNPDTAKYGNPQIVCKCLAEKVAAHLKYSGPQVFTELLQRNPNLQDPMAALTADPSFNKFAQDRLLSCVM
jgi:hypothetical protein